MSATEIIREIPKLTELERRAIRQALLDTANQDQDQDIAACNQSALEGALMLDRMEDVFSRPCGTWSFLPSGSQR